ncbi:MAG: NAD(P)H-dependent oxidoreductase [Bryobacteraceae bacterium]|nr:NAD(P)H-dependent oxidoreductase [Bryobacteraceae bacterium]
MNTASGVPVTRNPNEPRVRVVGLPGSVRPHGSTRLAVLKALEGAEAQGAITSLIELSQLDLPFAYDHSADYGGDVRKLREMVRTADGIILGTPEYHGGVSGVLKNALDLMGFEEFRGKMIGLIGVAGGAMGAHDALNTLRGVGRALHAWVVPAQAVVPNAGRAFAADGSLRDSALERRLLDVGREVARFALLHKCEEHVSFLREWEQAPENPGGDQNVRMPT